jgi:hypothetical protein
MIQSCSQTHQRPQEKEGLHDERRYRTAHEQTNGDTYGFIGGNHGQTSVRCPNRGEVLGGAGCCKESAQRFLFPSIEGESVNSDATRNARSRYGAAPPLETSSREARLGTSCGRSQKAWFALHQFLQADVQLELWMFLLPWLTVFVSRDAPYCQRIVVVAMMGPQSQRLRMGPHRARWSQENANEKASGIGRDL